MSPYFQELNGLRQLKGKAIPYFKSCRFGEMALWIKVLCCLLWWCKFNLPSHIMKEPSLQSCLLISVWAHTAHSVWAHTSTWTHAYAQCSLKVNITYQLLDALPVTGLSQAYLVKAPFSALPTPQCISLSRFWRSSLKRQEKVKKKTIILLASRQGCP